MNESTDIKPLVFAYQAPAIEMVISSDDLEREVHYAGSILSCIECGND